MNILWIGNAPFAGSGYGEQTALFVPRLAAQGHNVAVACNWGLQGAISQWNGHKIYPADGHWGNTTLATYAEDHKADLVIILHDAWVLTPAEWREGPPVAVWAPVDHYPIPPAVHAVLSHERLRPVAMSRFGEQQMKASGLTPGYVPHGVDTALFCPRPELRATVRDELGIPQDAFVIGMVAANKGNPSIPRKSFPEAFLAFSRFAKTHSDAFMYVHTEAKPVGGGIPLDVLATATGCPPGRLKFPPEEAWQLGMPRELIAKIYQAFDVLLNPAKGEGFGVPILEAQASGVPVICSDHSAMTELTAAGWLVTGDPEWDGLQSSWFIRPSIDSIVAALEAAYEARGDETLRAGAVAWAQDYDADLVAEAYWRPVLQQTIAPREVAPLNGSLNRAQRRRLAKQKVAA